MATTIQDGPTECAKRLNNPQHSLSSAPLQFVLITYLCSHAQWKSVECAHRWTLCLGPCGREPAGPQPGSSWLKPPQPPRLKVRHCSFPSLPPLLHRWQVLAGPLSPGCLIFQTSASSIATSRRTGRDASRVTAGVVPRERDLMGGTHTAPAAGPGNKAHWAPVPIARAQRRRPLDPAIRPTKTPRPPPGPKGHQPPEPSNQEELITKLIRTP